MSNNFDVVVIGGGPGGYVAAIRAAQLGMNVALVEEKHLGGVCLNWGCIPTKALLRSAEIYHHIKHAADFGIKVSKAEPDIKAMVTRSREVSQKLAAGVKHLLKKNKVTVIEARGKLAGNGVVETTSKEMPKLTAKNIIIATGARARVLPGLEPDGKLIWTAKEAMIPETLPKRLLVVGSGAIGVEFASFYSQLGAQVTIVEIADRILVAEDAEISTLAAKSFTKQGITIHTNTSVAKLDKKSNSVTATLKKQDGSTSTLEVDRVIAAVGVVGNSENLGLERTKVKTEKGQIITDEYNATAEPGVYAIGDVAGTPWLAHKASHEGIICAEKIAGHKVKPLIKTNIPGCTYSMPQIASVGLTEAAAKAAGHEIKVGRFSGVGNGKALAMGETEGLVKIIFDAKTGELLGAHMIGAEVTEMIQGYVITKTMEGTEEDLFHTIFPHPTMSEMMHEAALDAFKRAVHM